MVLPSESSALAQKMRWVTTPKGCWQAIQMPRFCVDEHLMLTVNLQNINSQILKSVFYIDRLQHERLLAKKRYRVVGNKSFGQMFIVFRYFRGPWQMSDTSVEKPFQCSEKRILCIEGYKYDVNNVKCTMKNTHLSYKIWFIIKRNKNVIYLCKQKFLFYVGVRKPPVDSESLRLQQIKKQVWQTLAKKHDDNPILIHWYYWLQKYYLNIMNMSCLHVCIP